MVFLFKQIIQIYNFKNQNKNNKQQKKKKKEINISKIYLFLLKNWNTYNHLKSTI